MAMPAHGAARLRQRAATLWGDGFVDDTLQVLWAVRDWSLCTPDEYVLLFPRLIPQDGKFPAVLRAQLESCVAARAWQLSRLVGGDGLPPIRSRLPEHGAAYHRDWFVDDDALTCWLRSLGLLHTAPERVQAERRVLASLDLVLFDIQAGRRPAWDEGSEILLAFGAGIHPGYLWPEATVSPARGITAGWLGHLDRGRRALMPTAVADYLLDAFDSDASPDSGMAAISGGPAGLALLLRTARRRLAGQNPPVRMPKGTVSQKVPRFGRMGPAHPMGADA